MIFNKQTNFAGEMAQTWFAGWIQQQESPQLISSACATRFHSSWSHIPEEAQMNQLLDKQGINMIILSKKYHREAYSFALFPSSPYVRLY